MGAVVVLLPADPETYAIEGGEAPEQLHVTLCYLSDDSLDPATIDSLKNGLSPIADGMAPVEAKVSGAGILGDDAAVVLVLESADIVAIYDQVKEVKSSLGLEAETFPSYIPHMTLGYPEDIATGDAMVQQALPWVTETIVLDQLAIMNGEDLHTVALGDAQPAEAAPLDEGDSDFEYAKKKKRKWAASKNPWHQLANPWHDQIGRFAPKGTGRTFPAPGSVLDVVSAIHDDGGIADDLEAALGEFEDGNDPGYDRLIDHLHDEQGRHGDRVDDMIHDAIRDLEVEAAGVGQRRDDDVAPAGETPAQAELRRRIENGADPNDPNTVREMIEDGFDPNELEPGQPRSAEPEPDRPRPDPGADTGESPAQAELRRRIENGEDPNDPETIRRLIEDGFDPNELEEAPRKKKAPKAFPWLMGPGYTQGAQFRIQFAEPGAAQAPAAASQPGVAPGAVPTKPTSVLIGLEVEGGEVPQAGAGLPYLAEKPYVALGEIDLRANELPEYVGMVIDSLEPVPAEATVKSSLTASNPVRRAMLMEPTGLVQAYETIKAAVQQSGLKWDDYPFAVQVGDVPIDQVKALKGQSLKFGSIIAVLPDGTVIRTGQAGTQAPAQATPQEAAPMSQMSDKLRAAAAAKRAVVQSPGNQFRLKAAELRAQFAEGEPLAPGEPTAEAAPTAQKVELVITSPDGATTVVGSFDYDGDLAAVDEALAAVTLTITDPSAVDTSALKAALDALGVQAELLDDLSGGLMEGGSFQVTARPAGETEEAPAETELAPAPEFAATVVKDDEDEDLEDGTIGLTPEQLEAEKEKLREAGKLRSAEWEGLLVVEGVKSGDGRQIEPEALTWRELPLPLMMMTKNPVGGDGHDGAELAGRIDWIKRRENGELWGGGGVVRGSDAGKEAARLLTPDENGFSMLRGVSVDLDDVEMSFESPEGFEIVDIAGSMPDMTVTKARVMGATLTPFPAFQEAQVVLVTDFLAASLDGEGCDCDNEKVLVASCGRARKAAQIRTWLPIPFTAASLVASAGVGTIPVKPPAAWFECPEFSEIPDEPVRYTADGRIYGLAADDKSCHIAFSDRCVRTPKSRANYRYFLNKQTETAEGVMVATGPIIMDSVHPRLKMQASDAQAFYAHTGSAVADVCVYDTPKGVYVAGALRPTATPEQIRALRGSDVSPDWRNIRGSLEMVALLAVNTSGFITPALVASAGEAMEGAVQPGRLAAHISFETGEVMSLVAAGMKVHAAPSPANSDDFEALRGELEQFRLLVQPLITADLERRRAEAATRFGNRRRDLSARHSKAAAQFTKTKT